MGMKRVLIFLSAAAVLLAACGADAADGDAASTVPPVPDGQWDLLSGAPIVDGFPVTLIIEGAGVNGRAACNSYFGSVAVDGASITIGQLGQTEMACEPAVMDSEFAYLQALSAVTTWERTADRLTLSGGDVELVFAPIPEVPTADLVGTTWQLETLIEGDAASTPVAGTEGFLLLEDDGTLTGSTGCRELSGTWVDTGGEILFDTFSAEGEPGDECREQDSLVVTVLGDGFRPVIEGDRLTVTSMGGIGLVFVAAD